MRAPPACEARLVRVTAFPGDRLELIGDPEDVFELGSLELLERQDVASRKAPHVLSSLTGALAARAPIPDRKTEGGQGQRPPLQFVLQAYNMTIPTATPGFK